MSEKFQGPSTRTLQENIEEGKGEGRGWRGEELVSTTFQTKVTPLLPCIAGKHTSNNRSTARSTTVLLLVVLNVVCRVQTVTSHQQETVSKNDSRFNHAIKQFFCVDGGAPTDGRRWRRQTYGGAPINFCRRRRRREKLGGAPVSARRGPLFQSVCHLNLFVNTCRLLTMTI
jgi:hypothetical protein